MLTRASEAERAEGCARRNMGGFSVDYLAASGYCQCERPRVRRFTEI